MRVLYIAGEVLLMGKGVENSQTISKLKLSKRNCTSVTFEIVMSGLNFNLFKAPESWLLCHNNVYKNMHFCMFCSVIENGFKRIRSAL